MGVYKEGKNWKVQVYYKDWQGNQKKCVSLYKNEKRSRDCTERSTEIRRYVQ